MNTVEHLQSTETRVALVQRYYRFHSEAEAALRPHLVAVEDLQFSRRCRSPLIAKNLKSLGHEPLPTENVAFNVHGQAQALGTLYVLEGSALGGRTILKSLVKQGASTDGLSFLDPYGHQTGDYWRSFLSILARETETEDAKEEAVSGALAAFSFAELSLCRGLAA
jgi:heme oxygenase